MRHDTIAIAGQPFDTDSVIELAKACLKPRSAAQHRRLTADDAGAGSFAGRDQLCREVAAADVFSESGGDVTVNCISEGKHSCIIMLIFSFFVSYRMKLFSTVGSPYARKVRIVLAEKRIDCEIIMLASLSDPDSPLPAHNPLGKVPTLVLDDGSSLYDSPVIAEYLDSRTPVAHLIPQASRIEVKRWEALADGMCDAPVAIVMEGRRAPEKQDAGTIERQQLKVERSLRGLSQDMGDSKWCVR